MGKHAARYWLAALRGSRPRRLVRPLGWAGSSSGLGQRFGTGWEEGVALVLLGFYESVVMLEVCVAAACAVARVSE